MNFILYLSRARSYSALGYLQEERKDLKRVMEFAMATATGYFQEALMDIKILTEGYQANVKEPVGKAQNEDKWMPEVDLFDDDTLREIAQVYMREGDAEFNRENIKSAASLYTKGIDVNCKDGKVNAILYFKRGLSYAFLDNLQETEKNLERGTKISAANSTGNLQEALKDLESAIQISLKDNVQAQVDKKEGNTEHKKKEFRNVLAFYTKLIDVNCKDDQLNAILYRNRAATHFSLGNLHEGIGNLKRSIEFLQANSREPFYKAHDQQNSSASQQLDSDDDTLRAIAQVYMQEGDTEYNKNEFRNAIGSYTEGIDLNCKDEQLNAILYINRAISNFSLGDFLEAAKDAKLARLHVSYSLPKICFLCLNCTKRGTNFQRFLYMAAVVTGAMAYKELGMDEEANKWCDDGLAIDEEHQSLLEVKCKSVFDEAKQSSGQEKNVETEIDADQESKYSKEAATFGESHDILNQVIAEFKEKEQMFSALQDLVFVRIAEKEAYEAPAYLALGIEGIRKGKIKEGISYLNQSLAISRELGDREIVTMAGTVLSVVYLSLSWDYKSVRDYEQAAEYFKRRAMLFKEIFPEDRMPASCFDLYLHTGDFEKAKKLYNENLAACKEVGDRVGEGRAYLDLGKTYFLKGKNEVKSAYYIRQAMSYYKKSLNASKAIGDKGLEGEAYLCIGRVHQHLGDNKQAKEHYKESLAIFNEIGDRKAEIDALESLLTTLISLHDLKQAMELSKQFLIVCSERKNQDILTIRLLLDQGSCLAKSGFLSDAVPFFHSVPHLYHLFSSISYLLTDKLRIRMNKDLHASYKMLWYVLLRLHRTEEALLAADKARAQALAYLLASQYGFEARQHDHVSQEETASELLARASFNTVFLAVSQNEINVWLLQDGEHVSFSRHYFHRELFELDRSLITETYEEIGVPQCVQCEDRSLDALRNNDGLTEKQPTDSNLPVLEKHLGKVRVDGKKESKSSPPVDKKRLSALYDAVVNPVLQHLHGNELVIVPHGPLFLIPFAALQDPESRYLCKSFRIRVIPSLTCLKMIMDAPPDHHCKSGALIVGDPSVQEVVNMLGKPKLHQLPAARKEAEMIATIVKSSPLIGSDATKEEVLKRLNSVALIHLAAHGDIKHGEIALAPNKSRTSKIPREEDFLLTMRDVLSVGLRARLVVLSCCHSGQGKIMDEGVVGIARAFLGAGARSVLVSLWAIEDDATLEFMLVFYQHLVEGKKASEALNSATNYMRKSPYFGEIRQWAPFVLIGDDVTLECFKGDLSVLDKVR